jgi:hypothetical protein
VVDNDGVHAKLEKCSDVKLAAGEHQIKVMMFQAAKEVVLSATYRLFVPERYGHRALL